MNTNKIFAGLLIAAAALVSCNKPVTYPDYDYKTVYFASQFPIRTIVLGEDLNIDNTLDNERKVSIKATMGGVRENRNEVVIGVRVDETLCNNLYFDATNPVVPMPASYFSLAAPEIRIPAGQLLEGVNVQFTDAFFADPKSLTNTYAIPLKMTSVTGADSILKGRAIVDNPNPVNAFNWGVKPQDYTVYVVKFVNTWHGNYLRRGVDAIEGKPAYPTLTRNVVRRKEYVEQDEIKLLTTRALNVVDLPIAIAGANNANQTMNLRLTFDDKTGECVISAAGTGYTATGKGKFVKKGEKKSWGNIDRDALYLEYTIDHPQMTVVGKDTLVMRDRAVAPQYFTPVLR